MAERLDHPLPVPRTTRALSGWRAACSLAAALLMFCGASVSLADEQDRRERRGGGGPGRLITEYSDELGIDATTRQRIEDIMRASGERHRDLRSQRRDLRSRLWDLMNAEDPNPAAVMEQAERLGDIETELQKNRLETLMRLRATLNAEQRAELSRLQARERPGRGRRRGPLRRCGGDLVRLCPEAQEGLETLACLRDNWDALSQRCRDSFDRSSRRRRNSR